MKAIWWLCGVLLAIPVGAQDLVQNGGFETVQAAAATAGWTIGPPAELPAGWALNTAYPGRVSLPTASPHAGQRCLRLSAEPNHAAHIYQALALQPGAWYRVSAWVRGGRVELACYEQGQGRTRGPLVTAGGQPGEWRRLLGYYHAPADGWRGYALALSVAGPQPVDLDDVRCERLDLPAAAAGPPVAFANAAGRLVFGRDARLRELRDPAGTEYAGSDTPVATVQRDGVTSPAYSLTPTAGGFVLRFLDPAVTVTVKVTPRAHHWRLEVVEAQPADVEALTLALPVRRLATDVWSFNGTYDTQQGICCFTVTANAHNHHSVAGKVVELGFSAVRRHGLVGAAGALCFAPFGQFKAAIMEAETDNGLPCPMIGGQWSRDSESARRSYLFSTGTTEADIDAIIEHAKLGGFGTIIFLKDDWLANHGHFDVNRRNFPDGLASVQRAVRKIHAAGLEAGVHVFGPSISPNDPYVTPRPDDRLLSVSAPPLATALDAQQTTITLTAPPANLPPFKAQSEAFPGNTIRIGDEVILTGPPQAGPPWRWTGCQRGALGTKATAHPAAAAVRGLCAMWGYYLVDPDSTLADELTSNFARVFNDCDFDFAYFDASDGSHPDYVDTWYYLNKLHLGFYRKFKRPVLYQTSMGTGSDLVFHVVQRSASADGHGDLKGYLDQRWPGILQMNANFTRPDIGWYYWFKECRPDQIEYVCAKALSVDGSISLETSRASTERLTQSRQMYEMIGRWERCRRAKFFGEPVKTQLREMQRDFRLFEPRRDRFELYRAVYEEPRAVDAADGRQNVWTIDHATGEPAVLGVEIVRGGEEAVDLDYGEAGALPIAGLDDVAGWRMSDRNRYEPFVEGGGKQITPQGPVRTGVTQSFDRSPAGGLLYRATNAGDEGGWGGIGRRFEPSLDLSAYRGIGFQLRGDGHRESVRVQFRDAAGRFADWVVPVQFTGTKTICQLFPRERGFDWTKVTYLLVYFNSLGQGSSAEIELSGLKALKTRRAPVAAAPLTLTLNGRRVDLPEALAVGQAITIEGPAGATLWPGGMTPGRRLKLDAAGLALQPGRNTITLGAARPEAFGGGLTVLVYRMWPLH